MGPRATRTAGRHCVARLAVLGGALHQVRLGGCLADNQGAGRRNAAVRDRRSVHRIAKVATFETARTIGVASMATAHKLIAWF